MKLEDIKKMVEEGMKWEDENLEPMTEEEEKDLEDRMNS